MIPHKIAVSRLFATLFCKCFLLKVVDVLNSSVELSHRNKGNIMQTITKTSQDNAAKTYTFEAEMGCKDGENRITAYLITTRIDGKFNWSERFTSKQEAQGWFNECH